MAWFRTLSVYTCLHFLGTTHSTYCPRSISLGCIGPFTIEKTSQPCADSALLTECIKDCINNHCCRAGGVKDGECVFSFKEDESLHFVKKVPSQVNSCPQEISNDGLQAFQSSVGYGGVASRAIDGNTDPVYGRGSCMHTGRDVHPWWAVDLGKSTQLAQVEITNRQKDGGRLRMLRIGTSDVSPLVEAPALTNFDRCATFDGRVGSAETRTFPCTTTGRYLIIQIEVTTNALNLCEVKVYADA